MMDIVFSLWADGGGFPDHAGEGAGALGAPVVGPIGLLDILETMRGLGGPASNAVVRVAAYQSALAATSGERFWSRSLAVDPWMTARTLLGWRDTLVAAGWRAEQEWTEPRLAGLAAAERAAIDLLAGPADRLALLEMELATPVPLPIRRLRLVDQRADLPAGWRRLVDRLAACGVTIEAIAPTPAAPEATALGRLQRWLLSGGALAGEPDGSITSARAASAPLAAELGAAWLAASGAQTVVIAQGADTHLLDQSLARAGEPQAGRSRASAHRGSLQILLLAFKCAWAPFDAHALMELLVMPAAPVAPRAARRLAAALEEAPGRGGPAWNEAWAEIEAKERDVGESETAKVEARLARWRSWADPTLADPVDGMPLALALAICDHTQQWALARAAGDGSRLYHATATLAADVRRAIAALGRERLPRTLIERLIDQALDAGELNPLAEAQAAGWRCVTHPGALWAPADATLWWNQCATAEGIDRQPWTALERAELATHGCSLDGSDVAARAASAAWERAIINTRAHLLLVSAGLDASEGEAAHPLVHRLAPALEQLATRVRLEEALTSEQLELGGVMLSRAAITARAVPAGQAMWTTPAGYAERMVDRSESATSFENLLSCQLMWALKHVAGLRTGRARSIPASRQLIGNLAHALARDIFQPGEPPAPADAAARCRTLLDPLVDQLAAPLRHPEFAAQLAEARSRLPDAMAALAQALVDNKLVVEATELQASRAFENALAVRGAIDLVARDPDGGAVIIDLKWTRSANRRINELRSGSAIQLATYGALLGEPQPYRGGFFLLNQLQFASLAGSGLIGRPIEGERTLPETWATVIESWRQLTQLAAGGVLVGRGVEGHEDHMPADLPLEHEVNCGWCDYATLCRVRGLR